MKKYTDDAKSVKQNRDKIRKVVGDNLKQFRKKHNDKQRDIAELLESNQPHISLVERGKSDLKSSMIPVLADRYDTYAETFFNENGKIPFDLLVKIIRVTSLEAESKEVSNYLDGMIDKIIEKGRGEDFLRLLFVSVDTCFNLKEPLTEIPKALQRYQDREILDDLKYRAESWGMDH